MERVRLGLWRLGSLVVLVAIWEGIVRLGWVDALFVPPPTAVARALGGILDVALARLGDTFLKTLVAYLLSAFLGVSLGLIVGSLRTLYQVFNPFLVVFYSLPKILILPWIILIFGIGVTPALIYATLHGVFPIALLVMGGVRDVDPHMVTVARSLGATPWQIYRKVMLPAVLPAVLAGLRLGIVFCLLGVLIVEMFAGIRGMGYLMASLANGFKAADLFAATTLVSVLSVAIVLALQALNSRLGRWRA